MRSNKATFWTMENIYVHVMVDGLKRLRLFGAKLRQLWFFDAFVLPYYFPKIHQNYPTPKSTPICKKITFLKRLLLYNSSMTIPTQGGLSQSSAWPSYVEIISPNHINLSPTRKTHNGESTALSLLSNRSTDGCEGRDVCGKHRS